MAWADPTREDVWEYNIAITKEVIEMGFGRVLFVLPRKGRDEDWETLERYAELRKRFR